MFKLRLMTEPEVVLKQKAKKGAFCVSITQALFNQLLNFAMLCQRQQSEAICLLKTEKKNEKIFKSGKNTNGFNIFQQQKMFNLKGVPIA